MIELELDGKKVSSAPGSTILEVAIREGKYIPHFCYHKKLSIAANCRMCLVEVEKAPKPLPACATPITEGMKVQTCSKLAVEAQKGVMELLLINHPLDCPICDQGGECQLQDLAIGYGRSQSRFEEEKRAVTNKDLGPLVATEMTRCIHCSRCIRFTDEIGGYQELGMAYRNNHVEVLPFIGKTVDSEISGNIIDICPVGALLSKPFKNKTRNWELSRRKSIAPHDGLGSNIIVQVDKYNKVLRVLPLENEAINECWLSDRDRFSYEGLNHQDRAVTPMIKQDGKWINVDWETAIIYAAKSISGVMMDYDAKAIGVLAGAISTVEELYLLRKLMHSLGVYNLDYRLNQEDFNLDGKQKGVNYLGSDIKEFTASKSIFIVGSILREEQPLLAHRIRQAVKNGCELNVLGVMQQDLLCSVKNQVTVDPRELEYFLAQVVKVTESFDADKDINLEDVEVSKEAQDIAHSLMHHHGYVVLGEMLKSLPNYSNLLLLAHQLVKNINGTFGILSGKANEVGAQAVGFLPYSTKRENEMGMNVKQMLETPRKAYVLFNTELEHDVYNANLALNALKHAQTVIVMSSFVSDKMKEYADVILPIAPFTETPGSFMNMEGKLQKFNAVTRPLEEAKPAWKVIRVLANELGVDKFEYDNIEDIRNELTQLNEIANLFDNSIEYVEFSVAKPKLLDKNSLIRFGIQGMYDIDSITRRAKSLQETKWAQMPTVAVAKSFALKMKIENNDQVVVRQGDISKNFKVGICDKLPETVIVLAVNNETIEFGGRFDKIEISKI